MRKLLIGSLLSFMLIFTACEDCSNFNGEYGCQSGQHEYPSDWAARSFQTPPRGQDYWRETYQDMRILMGYVSTKYSADRKSATLTFNTKVNANALPANAEVTYTFGDTTQSSNTFQIDSSKSYPDGMKVSAQIEGIATLELEKVYFLWDNPAVNTPSNYENGQKGAIVEFFGWPHKDIEEECDFLSTAGYMAAKVFPPNEAIYTFDTVEDGQLNPWWFIYQPVSYRMTSRMGTQDEFRSMITTCRKKNVRIYADAVVNHMAGNGNDMYPDHRNQAGGSCVHWGPKRGAAGSPWWTTGWRFENNPYTGIRPGLEFPSVPYIATDFHCERVLSSWSDPEALNYGWLTGLTDLNTESDYVRQRIADYITDLLSIGVSGVRIDAAKHISPDNLSAIFKRLKDNLGGGELPDDFTAYLEVLFGGEKDLLFCQDGDYNYGKSFENKMKAAGLSDADVNKIKIWGSDYPKEFPICGYWAISAARTAIGLDCHDDQNPGSSSRDMGDKGSVYIKEKDANKHRNFEIELFTRQDEGWKIKLVLSSYSFMNNGGNGFPDGGSDCSACTGTQCKENCNKSVPYQKAYDPSSTGYDCGGNGGWKEGTYTRVHRDQQIVNAMRKWMGLNELSEDELYGKERMKAAMMKQNATQKMKFIEA